MGLFALISNRWLRRTVTRRREGPVFAPRRLERRRVLDAAGAELLLGPLSASSDFVQTDDVYLPEEPPPPLTSQMPTNLVLVLSASEIAEGELLQLDVSFDDPDVVDMHTATIDWGDGSIAETVNLADGDRSFSVSHQYTDDNPTATSADQYTIRMQITDDAGNRVRAATDVTVHNVAPQFDTLSVTNPVDEFEFANLTGTYSDPGTEDTFQLDIDWDGDHVFDQTVTVSGGQFEVFRQFFDDDPTGTPSDTHDIHVRLRDDDAGATEATLPLTIQNVAPSLSLSLFPGSVNEGGQVEVLLAFVDQGLTDSHQIKIYWGDGSAVDYFAVPAGGHQFYFLSHVYADDTSSDTYTIVAKIADDDGGEATYELDVLVRNVAPVLTVASDQTINEGALLDLTGGGLGSFVDIGLRDTHTATVNWGDGTATESATINQGAGFGSIDGTHYYADNGLYTVTVTLTDDDGGTDVATFQVTVNNVNPMLVGIDPVPTINEGSSFTLASLGVSLSDPGFDNPLNPLVPMGSQETFASLSVNWGDGTATQPLNVVNRTSGDRGIPTTAEFDHTPHTYADNGLYTVTLVLGDDDGGLVERTFQINVKNVAPNLVLTDRVLEINEGDTLDLFDLATFSDPGFNNPLNVGDPSNGGEVSETFTYIISWGDGTLETGQLPTSVVAGSVGVDTTGTLVDSHQYLDNDDDNLYSILVTLVDDDGGAATREIFVRVFNVDPTLEPVTASDLNTRGETQLSIEFADPGTELLTVWVDWGDKLALPPDQRFVPETVVLGPGTQTMTLMHTYTGPPNPMNPAADIVISVFIRDDDFGLPLVVAPGQSVTQTVAITNPGEGVNPVRIDLTPQVPRLVFPSSDDVVFVGDSSGNSAGSLQSADLRTATGDTKSIAERYFELRVIDPATGAESEGYRLQPEVLEDLPGFFKTLPDNHYKIYLVQTETNTRRLVIDVYVRNGKLIDPGDDSEGTRDRPPTDEAEPAQQTPPDDATSATERTEPLAEQFQGEQETKSWSEDADSRPARSDVSLAVGAIGLAASASAKSWSERIDRAIAAADSQKWSQLRRRYRYKRKND